MPLKGQKLNKTYTGWYTRLDMMSSNPAMGPYFPNRDKFIIKIWHFFGALADPRGGGSIYTELPFR